LLIFCLYFFKKNKRFQFLNGYKGVWTEDRTLCAVFFMIDNKAFLDQILQGYQGSYDIERIDDAEEGLVAKASMHVTESQCLIFKEFEMWTANADEYVYIYRYPHLTKEIADRCIAEAYEAGMPLIDLDYISLKHQHMCTHLVALFLCDTADEDAVKSVKKCKIYKSFQFSLKGWMEMHTDLITYSDAKIVTNCYGTSTAKFLKMHVDHYKKQANM